MATEDIIDAWALVRAGQPFDAFKGWFSDASFHLEEGADLSTRDLSLGVRRAVTGRSF